MNLACLFRKHAWNGCVCARCGESRNQDHDWDGCVCRRCGATRSRDHEWNGCFCKKCGAESHDFEVIEKEEYQPTCCYGGPDDICTGPGCSAWCTSNPGSAWSYEKVRCRRCGKVEEHGERPQ